jgi:hypothetical protein
MLHQRTHRCSFDKLNRYVRLRASGKPIMPLSPSEGKVEIEGHAIHWCAVEQKQATCVIGIGYPAYKHVLVQISDPCTVSYYKSLDGPSSAYKIEPNLLHESSLGCATLREGVRVQKARSLCD